MRTLRFAAIALALLFSLPVQSQNCPTQDSVCRDWPPYIGYDECMPTGWCQGKDCFKGGEGIEIDVLPLGKKFPDTWLARTEGELGSAGGLDCEVETINRISLVGMPPERHCSMLLSTENFDYLEFIASNSAVNCMGWVECLCKVQPGQ